MKVIELRDKLNEFIAQGKGDITITTTAEDGDDLAYVNDIDGVNLAYRTEEGDIYDVYAEEPEDGDELVLNLW